MGRNKEIVLFATFVILNCIHAEILFNFGQQKDPCALQCQENPLSTSDTSLTDSEKKSLTNSCQRGCRFFHLVDAYHGLTPNNPFNNLESCNGSCTEAYGESQDRTACNAGCSYMAGLPEADLMALISFTLQVARQERLGPNLFISIPETPENDILTDPALRKELMPGWWDSGPFKLPETYFKTVPMDSEMADYSVPYDYNVESEKSTSIPGSDWLQCASRHTGIPKWLLGTCIITATISALWLCLSPEKSNDSADKIIIANGTAPHKVTVYLPDEVPLTKKPPPKYSDVVDSSGEEDKL